MIALQIFKMLRDCISPIKRPDCMIDLNVEVNTSAFVVYEPRDIHKSIWVHGSRISI